MIDHALDNVLYFLVFLKTKQNKKKGKKYLGPPKTPAFWVSWSTRAAALGSTLEALEYIVLIPSPDATKKAPFSIKSPSVLQFQFAHSPSSVESTRFVTCFNQKIPHNQLDVLHAPPWSVVLKRVMKNKKKSVWTERSSPHGCHTLILYTYHHCLTTPRPNAYKIRFFSFFYRLYNGTMLFHYIKYKIFCSKKKI